LNRGLPWGGLWAAISLLFLFPLTGAVVAQDQLLENPSKVETAFLRNFARYVTWPTRAFANERAPWSICILGSDVFDDVLEQTLRDRTEQGRAFEVFRAKSLDQLPPCQIVFVGYQDAAKRRGALAELKNQPILTVGNAPEFLQEGGIIRLLIGERIEMSINLDQARSVSLTIPTKMLEVSREVVENGAVRRLR
jgi:uncharacterized protein DUF4154